MIRQADNWNQDWTAADDPVTDTFHVLERFYALFGLPSSANPYRRRRG
ncbi:MAG TPA: hypothetical protein VGX23_02735 [Actinocrinis sp.]|nr:hypothetical protein [Actinocrinis sp.]